MSSLGSWPPIAVLACLLSGCGATEPIVEGHNTVVAGSVTVGGVPAASGSVELFPADVATVQTVELGASVVLGRASVEAGAYRISADVGNPAFCASLSVSLRVEDASGATFGDTRRLGTCGEHRGVDFAF